jgi:hypothetical protein
MHILLIHSNEAGMQAISQEDAGRMVAAYGAYTEAVKAISHASGLRGTPCAGQSARAGAKASVSASSAAATSLARAARKATSLP